MVGLLALKICVPAYTTPKGKVIEFGALGIDILFWAISIIGAFEFMRAVGEISRAQYWTVMITCSLATPAFVLFKMFLDAQASLLALLSVISLGMMVVTSLMVFDFERSTLRSTAFAELCILYCGVLTVVGPNINHMEVNSAPAILLLFILVPAVDSFAFFFGMLFGKFVPIKLAPHVSPHKTMIGAFGGMVGGLFGAVLTWLACTYIPLESVNLVYGGPINSLGLLMLIAVPTPIFSQLGDLFESAIKRGCNIKDMGKLLPGHGGVLDRFDSMLFATIPIVVSFMLV